LIAASRAVQRPAHARLLHVDAYGRIAHAQRCELPRFVHADDVIVANDAATLPASLQALHLASNSVMELRLAGRDSLRDGATFQAVLFGAGDHRTRTEDRPLPSPVRVNDRLLIGSVQAVITAVLDHPRFVRVRFDADRASLWRMLARHGRPIQYAHVPEPLALWDVWTPIAATPVAYEAPSAAFALSWSMLAALRARGAGFVTVTHAAGISSTGDSVLDERLPFDEPYCIPAGTVTAIENARRAGKRVIAVGTTVVRALEAATQGDCCLTAGNGIASGRIGAGTNLRSVDAILSGTHEVGTSHYELLRAFVDDDVLRNLTRELDAHDYLTHEFGDSVLLELDSARQSRRLVRSTRALRSEFARAARKASAETGSVCG